MKRMTLTNESITFYTDGIRIQPLLSDSFRFEGSVQELIDIMIQHKELDIDNAIFRVRDRSISHWYISPSTEGY